MVDILLMAQLDIFNEKEKLLLKHINKTKIFWKKSNDPLMQ